MLNPRVLGMMVDDRTRELREMVSGQRRRPSKGVARRRSQAALRLLRMSTRRR